VAPTQIPLLVQHRVYLEGICTNGKLVPERNVSIEMPGAPTKPASLLPGTGNFADRCRWGTAGEIGFQQVPAARLVYWAPVTTNDPAVNAGFAVSPRRQFPLQGRSPKTASVVPQQHGCVPRQKPHVSHQVRTCFTSEPQLSHPVRTCPTSKPNIRLQDGAKSILSIISRRSSGGKGSPVVVH